LYEYVNVILFTSFFVKNIFMVVHNQVKEEENQKPVDRSILQEKEENQ